MVSICSEDMMNGDFFPEEDHLLLSADQSNNVKRPRFFLRTLRPLEGYYRAIFEDMMNGRLRRGRPFSGPVTWSA